MKKHIGEVRINKDGLTIQLKRWNTRENVEVEILESGQRIWTTYADFRKGKIKADLLNYPLNNDCSLAWAIFLSISVLMVFFGIIFLISYCIFT